MIYCHLHMQHHNDTINKQTSEDFFTKYIPLTLLVTFERVIQGLRVRGSWRPNRNCNILTPTLMAVSVVSFSFSRCSTGSPRAHSAGWWLSLLHLTSNFSGPQLIRAPRPLRPDVAFPTISRLYLISNCNSSWLSYIIVQRPLNRLLDLWNGMIDRHPGEITVMQFTGYSLPVHQSMSVPWGFFLPRPISSANLRPRDFLS